MDHTKDTEATKEQSGKTRTVDYQRTDKRPHSFRYKRGTAFVPRDGAVSLAKEPDGTFVIGPTSADGTVREAASYAEGELRLVSVKKRLDGRTAVVMSHPELGSVVAYDARSARAALKAKSSKA